MILCVSQRTDICAFYSDWLIQRLKEGFADVRNPFQPKLVQRIPLHQDWIDTLLLITKNPIPILRHLDTLSQYCLAFQITVTPYGKEIEPGLPDKKDILEAVCFLAQQFGKNKVLVRYDPLFLSSTYTMDYHEKAFLRFCQKVGGKIDTVIISFLDIYKNTEKNKKILGYLDVSTDQIKLLAEKLALIAQDYGIQLQTCAEEIDLQSFGFRQRSCMDEEYFAQVTGNHYHYKEGNLRPHCHCVQVTDLGVYNSCPHLCHYCYANYDEALVMKNHLQHDSNSSLLIGHLAPDDIIKVKKIEQARQINLF